MAEKSIELVVGELPIRVVVGTAVRRAELYGRQVRSVEKDGQVLEEVVLDPAGRVFLRSDIAHLQTDVQGSLLTPALVQTEGGEPLPQQLSSFSHARSAVPTSTDDLARLRVSSVYPIVCDLPAGIYRTEFSYRDAAVVKSAVINVTSAGAFLLVGTFVASPLHGKDDVYNFFYADDELDDGAGEDEQEDDEEKWFEMF